MTDWVWYVYSGILWLLGQFLRPLVAWRRSWRDQLAGRRWSQADWHKLQNSGEHDSRRVVCYCSSAGEYEQALPLIQRLEAAGSKVLVLVFSESGMRFVRSQQTRHWVLKSPWDFIWLWRRFFRLFRPQVVMVVRHELWPGFLAAAKKSESRLILIDAVMSRSQPSLADRWVKRRLLAGFDWIATVDQASAAAMTRVYRLPANRFQITGDTKYDRVVERQREREPQRQELAARLASFWPRRRRLILGSAWPADVALILPVFQRLLEPAGWQLMIAPHETDAAMVEKLTGLCREHGLAYHLWSQVDAGATNGEIPVLIVNAMGLLAELYGCADMAFVGGAMHHRVHNVLEPACRGLPLAFGPKYSTSQEAKWLVERGLARSVTTAEDVASWWSSWHQGDDLCDHKLLASVQELSGASEAILPVFHKTWEEQGVS
jgi:3-deoxy-D-manno-octulosonic-acid transferase